MTRTVMVWVLSYAAVSVPVTLGVAAVLGRVGRPTPPPPPSTPAAKPAG
ncbi:MAG: hypothetical protein M3326_00055 [Actinomycetota bacterium]|nr:hypothetical protein [Actinomycetota bacterium]